MKNCQKCSGYRLADITGKCSSCFNVTVNHADHDGSVPNDMGIGSGDYIEFTYCLNCGQIQGQFPLPITELEKKNEEKAGMDYPYPDDCEGYIEPSEEVLKKLKAGIQSAKDHPLVTRESYAQYADDSVNINNIMAKPISEKIVATILDAGLSHSTFRDLYPEAYEELLKYRQDMIKDTQKVIDNSVK